MPKLEGAEYAPGSCLGKSYRIRCILGRGGMGEVYLVERAGTGDLLAAKVMRARREVSAEQLRAFRQEALSMLNMGTHPFVVRLYELLDLGRDTALVMEFVAPTQGCTSIQDHIVRTHDYTDRMIGVWAVGFCVGMEHALAQGVAAHRDIKPANLLVGSGVFLKIADFGLALAASQVPEMVTKRAGEPALFQELRSIDGRRTCGTPGYIAPELLLGGQASPKSDMFSFGVTLWQLAARSMEMPFQVTFQKDVAAYQEAVLRKAMAGKVRPLDSPFFPVIQRCLCAEPARRFEDFRSLREAIKDAAKQAGIGAMDFLVKEGFAGEFAEYLNRGRGYLALGQRNRALRIFDRAIEHNSRSESALEGRGETRLGKGDAAGALRDFKAASQLNPEWDAPIIGIAMTLLEMGEVDLAGRHLDQVLRRHPSNTGALLEKANAESRYGRSEAALELVQRVLEADPQHPRAYEYLGRILWTTGKFSDAVKALQHSLVLDPLQMETRLALAAVLIKTDQGNIALQHYRTAQALHHGNAEALNRIAAHMSEHGHAEEAINLFQEIAIIDPSSQSVILVNIGNAHLELGEESRAIASFREAIKVDPKNALAFRRLGDCEDAKGNPTEAADYYEKACTHKPGNASHHACAGTALLRIGEQERAREHLATSIRLIPEQPHILYNLAVAHVQCGDPTAALDQLNIALNMDRKYALAWYLKAQLEVQMKRPADATDSVRQAFMQYPDMPTEMAEALRSFASEHDLRV